MEIAPFLVALAALLLLWRQQATAADAQAALIRLHADAMDEQAQRHAALVADLAQRIQRPDMVFRPPHLAAVPSPEPKPRLGGDVGTVEPFVDDNDLTSVGDEQ